MSLNPEATRLRFTNKLVADFSMEKWFKEGYRFLSKPTGYESHRTGFHLDGLGDFNLDPAEEDLVRAEINTGVVELRYDDRLIPSHPKLRLGDDGRFIIGWELTNDRDDGHSGEAFVRKADRDAIEIEVYPDSLRDSYWTLRVFSVDPVLYGLKD
ncbi:hypothetical protein JCM6882_000641 [Rhodosporidiobolus microsporus]